MNWLRMVRDHVANFCLIERNDLELSLFDAKLDALQAELNEVLVA